MKTTKFLSVCLTALLVGLMSMNATPIGAQTGKHDLTRRTWSDGYVAYTVRRTTGGLLLFESHSLYEGEQSFALKPEGGDFYRLQTAPGQSDIPFLGEPGYIVRLRPYGPDMYLVIYDEKNLPVNVLAPINDLKEWIEDDLSNYYLAGEYRTADGRTITFYPSSITSRRRVKGLVSEGDEAIPYDFGLEYNTPANIIVLPDGSAYRVVRDEQGLTVYGTSLHTIYSRALDIAENAWTDDEEAILRNARRTGFLSNSDDSVSGDFPCAAMRALTLGQLSRFTDEDLQLMRNEIYARRGLRFSENGELQRHFESKSWYHPEADDVSDRLTELDALNISMIRRAEEMRKIEPCRH